MHNLLLFIPLFFCLFLLLFFTKKVVWWEYCIIVIPSIIIVYIGTVIMISNNCADKEWYSYGVDKVRYYEEWDEWISRTCTRQVPSGIDSDGNTTYTTETYDCSYRDYHEEMWTIVLNDPSEIEQEIKKEFYDKICCRWIIPNKNQKRFVDMKRDFYKIDGNMYELNWNDSIKDYFCYTLESEYKNKVKAAKSVFGFVDVSDEERKNNSLYDYNTVVKHPDLGPMLGWLSAGNTYQQKVYGSSDKELNKEFDYINGILGNKKQVQIYLLLYNAQQHSKDVAFLQQSLWEGGNKNELNICLGVDSAARKIIWSKVFSWSETPETEVRIESFFNSCDSLSVKDTFVPFRKFLNNNINKYWKRKEFSDFDYLNVELTYTQLKTLSIIVTIWCLISALFCILNAIIYSKDYNVINKNNHY